MENWEEEVRAECKSLYFGKDLDNAPNYLSESQIDFIIKLISTQLEKLIDGIPYYYSDDLHSDDLKALLRAKWLK